MKLNLGQINLPVFAVGGYEFTSLAINNDNCVILNWTKWSLSEVTICIEWTKDQNKKMRTLLLNWSSRFWRYKDSKGQGQGWSINGVGVKGNFDTYSGCHCLSARVNKNSLPSTEVARPVVCPRCIMVTGSMFQISSRSTMGSMEGARSCNG